MNQTLTPSISPRKPWIAVTLSLVFPGLGHIYAGKIAKGLLLAILSVVPYFVVLFPLALPPSLPQKIVLGTIYLSMILISIYILIDSAFQARKSPSDYRLKDYNRWYVYLFFILLGTGSGAQAFIHYFDRSFAVFSIPNTSMFPTFINHDRFIANRTAYDSSDPERGDVVVFSSPDDKKITSVRRVVALAGDTVEIKNGRLILNGQPLPLEKIAPGSAGGIPGEIFRETNGSARYQIFLSSSSPAAADLPKFTVPKYHCIVLADNRNQVKDSRTYGPLPCAAIKARADFLYFTSGDWSRFGKIRNE
jgi:signal peptidase I